MDTDNCSFETVVFKIEKSDENWEAGEHAANGDEQRDVCQEYPIDIEEIKVEESDNNSTILPEFVNVEDEDYTSEASSSMVDECQDGRETTTSSTNQNDSNRQYRKTSIAVKRTRIIKNADGDERKLKLARTGEKPYTCDICGRNFRLKESLDKHMAIHGEENIHTCHVCSRKFGDVDTLHHHMLAHAEENIQLEKPFACDLCSKKFHYESQLYKHMVRHMEDKPHACDVCPAKFRFKSHLIKHLPTHVGKKPHKCLVCSETFYQINQLNKHVRIHTRPWSDM